MDLILIKLQQKHDQHKQRIEHEESEYRLIAQLDELARDPGLKEEAKRARARLVHICTGRDT